MLCPRLFAVFWILIHLSIVSITVGTVGNSWDIKIPCNWDGDLTTYHISDWWTSREQSIENQIESVKILTKASFYLSTFAWNCEIIFDAIIQNSKVKGVPEAFWAIYFAKQALRQFSLGSQNFKQWFCCTHLAPGQPYVELKITGVHIAGKGFA